MSLFRNRVQGRGLRHLALALIVTLFAALLAASPARSVPSGQSMFADVLAALRTASSVVAAAKDEYVPATNPLVTPGLVARGDLSGAGIIYPGGPGHPTDVYAVKWSSDGKQGWCYRFGLHTPNSNGATLVSRIPGMTRDESRHVFYVVNKYHTTKSDVVTAAVAFVVWHYENSAQWRRWFSWAKKNGHIGPAVLKAYRRILAESKQHGPYKMDLKLGGEKLVGQEGHGVVTVKTAHGRPAKGRAVQLYGTSVRITSSRSRTNDNGKLAFTYVRTHTDRVKVRAALTAPGVKGYLSSPSEGNQALVLAGPDYKKTVSAGYQRNVPAPKVKVDCETSCKKATVVLSGRNPEGAKPIRYALEVDSKVRAKLDIRPGSEKSLSRNLADGSKVEIYACYLNKVGGKCVTPRNKMGHFTVVCPPWAKARLVVETTMACEKCSSQTSSLMFKAPNKSTRFYTGVYKLNGEVKTFNFPADGEWHLVNGVTGGKVTDVGFRAYKNSSRTGKRLLDVTFDCPTCG